MKQEVLSQFDLPWLPVTALIIFIVCFTAYFVWTFSKANTKNMEEASQIPLEEPARASSVTKGHTV